MFQIKDTLISTDVIGKKFTCDMVKCKGACCVHGDSGAPLEDKEVEILKSIFSKIKSYLREEGVEVFQSHSKNHTQGRA